MVDFRRVLRGAQELGAKFVDNKCQDGDMC